MTFDLGNWELEQTTFNHDEPIPTPSPFPFKGKDEKLYLTQEEALATYNSAIHNPQWGLQVQGFRGPHYFLLYSSEHNP